MAVSIKATKLRSEPVDALTMAEAVSPLLSATYATWRLHRSP